MNKVFEPAQLGRYTLGNHLVMAPMTRSRAQFDGTPGELSTEYYAQRASVGLIITEGAQPSDDGQGYLATPGIYTDAHIQGWKKTIDAVHAKGSHIFIQLRFRYCNDIKEVFMSKRRCKVLSLLKVNSIINNQNNLLAGYHSFLRESNRKDKYVSKLIYITQNISENNYYLYGVKDLDQLISKLEILYRNKS
ncbi:hypothetical protein F2A31_05940 [Acinetobacter suaedae]|uniref:NADH:flavin oxidoreductase/NADH oxidase N-terminal domain-containing protein n=2 Tax=Acinetobacter suaedae TaxID=2609668 RepID=A0A5P1UWJ9_9GAMM|nr:hypothetical protein F2A31_05940 [Acinetobacter sp. C16S1]